MRMRAVYFLEILMYMTNASEYDEYELLKTTKIYKYKII